MPHFEIKINSLAGYYFDFHFEAKLISNLNLLGLFKIHSKLSNLVFPNTFKNSLKDNAVSD